MKNSRQSTNKYLNKNLSPKQFRFVRIAPFILSILILGNFLFKNLQYEASKPILQKFDESTGMMTYYDKESNELFNGKASWMLRYNNQKFEGSFKNGLLNGKSKIWYQNGNLAQETIYVNGVISSKTSWDENGIKIISFQ